MDTSLPNSLSSPSIDWRCNNKALTVRLVQELQKKPYIRRILWPAGIEPRTNSGQRKIALAALVRALFFVEPRIDAYFKSCVDAVAGRIKRLRSKYRRFRARLMNSAKVDWDMTNVGNITMVKIWENTLERCPYFRILAFFNGDIQGSEFEGSVASLSTVGARYLNPPGGPDVLHCDPEYPSCGNITRENPTEEEGGTGEEESEDLHYEGRLWSGGEWYEKAGIVGTMNRHGRIECGRVSVPQCTASHSTLSPVHFPPIDCTSGGSSNDKLAQGMVDHSYHQTFRSGESHQEPLTGIAPVMSEAAMRREQMRLDYKLQIKRLELKEKTSKRKLRVARKKVEERKRERDETHKHEKFMIKNKIRLAKIERGVGKDYNKGSLPKTGA